MSDEIKQVPGLPDNAYKELKPGEVYQPVMPAGKTFPEVTPWSIGMGLLMAVIFSGAAAYSGLKIGQVFEAAIPISIIAVGASAALRKKNALGQNIIPINRRCIGRGGGRGHFYYSGIIYTSAQVS